MQNSTISKLSHDLQQPMTTIKGYLAIVLDGSSGEIPEKAKEFLQKAYDSNEKLIEMVNNFSSGQQPSVGQPAPQVAIQQPATATQQAGAPQASLDQTVLLIEDDPLLVKMYQTKFETEGFKVLTVSDGETGLKTALEQKVDFIILDMMMPKMSGLDLLTKLRQDPRGQSIPVIVLSNLAQQEQAQKAIQLGAKEFLLKANFTPSQVVAKVRQYLGK